ncbi:MAG: PIN domain-containing protein [Gemmatimonadota bacterium]
MTRIVVDTGPLVALRNRRDAKHAWTRKVLDTIAPPLWTCDAVVTEACFLLRHVTGGQDSILELLAADILRIDFNFSVEVAQVRTLMSRFQSVPMSFADACLVRMTELVPKSTVLTLDNDFLVYRRNRRLVVPTIMPRGASI